MNRNVNPADARNGVVAYSGDVKVCPVTGKQTNCYYRSEVTGKRVLAYNQEAANVAHRCVSGASIYWRDLPESAQVIDRGASFSTHGGACIYWHGNEAAEAQAFLGRRATKN